jgi:hypothetical protein
MSKLLLHLQQCHLMSAREFSRNTDTGNATTYDDDFHE